MDHQIVREKQYVMIDIAGNINRMPDSLKFSELINQLLTEAIPCIVIDLTKTKFVSSSICGFLVSAIKRVEAEAKPIRFAIIITPKSSAFDILNVAGIPTLVDMYASMKEFKASLP